MYFHPRLTLSLASRSTVRVDATTLVPGPGFHSAGLKAGWPEELPAPHGVLGFVWELTPPKAEAAAREAIIFEVSDHAEATFFDYHTVRVFVVLEGQVVGLASAPLRDFEARQQAALVGGEEEVQFGLIQVGAFLNKEPGGPPSLQAGAVAWAPRPGCILHLRKIDSGGGDPLDLRLRATLEIPGGIGPEVMTPTAGTFRENPAQQDYRTVSVFFVRQVMTADVIVLH